MSSTPAASKPSTGRKATKATTTTATPAPVAAPVPAPAPAPVVAPVAVPPTVDAVTADGPVDVVAQFTAAVEKVTALRTALGTVFADLKKLEKQIPRELKRAQKGRRARRAEATDGAPKKPTIFKQPTPISDSLCAFLGVAKGTQISRSEVTSRVCKYAKDKGLMEKQNIRADAALRKLLALKEGDDLKILNLQRYLKPHYLKPAAPATTSA